MIYGYFFGQDRGGIRAPNWREQSVPIVRGYTYELVLVLLSPIPKREHASCSCILNLNTKKDVFASPAMFDDISRFLP